MTNSDTSSLHPDSAQCHDGEGQDDTTSSASGPPSPTPSAASTLSVASVSTCKSVDYRPLGERVNWGKTSDVSLGSKGVKEPKDGLPEIREEGCLEKPNAQEVQSADNGQTDLRGGSETDGGGSENGGKELEEISSS